MKHYFLVLIMCVAILSGQQLRTHFFRITQTDGLSVNQVQSVACDEWGYLWIGTSNGLNRYNGSSFVIHRPEPDIPHRLSNSNCYALLYDQERKTLWIGTHGGGLNRYHIPSDRFEQVPIPSQEHRLPGTEDIFALLLDESGRLWFGGSCGLMVIPSGCNIPSYLPLFNGKEPESRPCHVTSLAQIPDGQIIAGSEQGLWVIRHSQGASPVIVEDQADLKQGIWSLCPGEKGDLWVGCESGALYRLDRGYRVINRFHHSCTPGFPAEGINALCRDQNQRLWIGSFGGGLLCLEANSRVPILFSSIQSNPFSLPGDQINCLFHDPEGSVWIGTDNGLGRYDPLLECLSHYGRDEPADHLLRNSDIVTMAELPEGLWLGTSEGTIQRIPRPDIGTKTGPAEVEIDLGAGSLTKLIADGHERLWCATENGLLQLDRHGAILKRFVHSDNSNQGLPDSTIITLMADRQDRLWIGSNSRGVCLLHMENGTFSRIPRENLPSLSVWAMIQDHPGQFWLGSRDGLFLLSPDLRLKKSFNRASIPPDNLGSNWITALFEDSRQRIWVGTAGAGLYLSRYPEPGFRHFDRRQGLPDDDVLSILEDPRGGIWLSSGRGLCRIDPDLDRARVFTYRQGLGALDFNIDAALALRSDLLAYGSSAGLDLFTPVDLLVSRPKLPLHIESLHINTRLTPLSPPLFLRRQLILPYSRDIIRFDFASIGHRRPDSLFYRYRLKGWNDEWMETDISSRQAVFGQLPPGSYRLEVMALAADGTEVSKRQSLDIRVPAPFWKTTWFNILAGLGFALLSYSFIHFFSGYLHIRRFWHRKTCIGQFRLGHRIGSGGMADVFSGISLSAPKTQVAIKILREDLSDDPLSRRRFHQEAAIIDRLEHPNIVQVLERGSHDGRPYMVMELLRGVTLAHTIDSQGPLPLNLTAPITIQICSALEQIHRKGILHRDLKPANIMLNTDRGEPQVKLLDFGLSRLISQSRMTRSGTVMGTLSYLAPELIGCQEASPASDVFSLGVLVFEMLTGVLPYTGGSAGDLLNQILIEPPPSVGELGQVVPDEIEIILNLMLAKMPTLRPALADIRHCFISIRS